MKTDHRRDPSERAEQIISVVIEQEDIDPLDEDEVRDAAFELADEICCWNDVTPYINEATRLMGERTQNLNVGFMSEQHV